MNPGSPKPFRRFAVVALQRPGLTEAVIAWRKDEKEARRFARRCMAAMPDRFARCRVRPVDLTVEQAKAICFRWGMEAARDGEPVANDLPGVYGEAYRRGFESVRQPPPGAARLADTPGPQNQQSDEPEL